MVSRVQVTPSFSRILQMVINRNARLIYICHYRGHNERVDAIIRRQSIMHKIQVKAKKKKKKAFRSLPVKR